MAERARVTSVDEIRKFRHAMGNFMDDMRSALLLVRSDMVRTQNWIEYDQLRHWESTVKKRTKQLSQARNDLNRKELTSDRSTDERRALDRAKHQLEDSKRKLRTVRKWAKWLPGELDKLTGVMQQLNGVIERDSPAAMSTLDQISKSIQSYLALHAPTVDPQSASVSTFNIEDVDLADITIPEIADDHSEDGQS